MARWLHNSQWDRAIEEVMKLNMDGYPLPEGMRWKRMPESASISAWSEKAKTRFGPASWYHAWATVMLKEIGEQKTVFRVTFDRALGIEDSPENPTIDKEEKLFDTMEDAVKYISIMLMMGFR